MKEFINRAKYSKIAKYFQVKSKRPRIYDLFDVLDGILYVLVTGCQWRNLSSCYPPYRIVFYYFSKWKNRKVFHKVLSSLNNRVNCLGRTNKPRILIIDNQSISDSDLPSLKDKGYDGHKKRKGRKRCILVDISGNIHCIKYLPANFSDVNTAKVIVQNYRLTPFGKNNKQQVSIYGDKGFHSPDLKEYCKTYNVNFQALIRQKLPDLTTKIGQEIYKQQYGYITELIKSIRWVVEQTFAWLQKYRRLNMNYERTISSLEAMTLLAAIRIKLRSS